MKVVLHPSLAAVLVGPLLLGLSATPALAAGGSSAAGSGLRGPSLGHVGTVVDSRYETDPVTGEVIFGRSRTETYDSRGRLTHDLEIEIENDQVVYRSEATYEHTDTGLERAVEVVDFDGDGPSPADVIVTTFTVDKRGFLVAVDRTYDYGADGTIDASDHETYTPTQKNRTSTAHLEWGGGPGPDDDEVIDTTYTYDKRGNVVGVVETVDLLATPQSPDTSYDSVQEYDAKGSFVSSVDSFYVYDEQGVRTLDERYTYQTTRSKDGSVVTDHSTGDFDGDGVVDGVQDTVATYDGDLETSRTSTYVEDGVTSVESSASTYDKRGNLLTYHTESSTDGVTTSVYDEVYTFDAKGRILGWVFSEDFDGDGTYDEVATRDFDAWDNKGRFTHHTTTVVDGAGNVIEHVDSTTVWTRYYETRTSEVDEGGDGTIDLHVVTVIPLVFG